MGLSDEAPATGLAGEELCSTAQHASAAEAQRIRCVNTGGLEEGMALQETVIQTDSSKMDTPFSQVYSFRAGLPAEWIPPEENVIKVQKNPSHYL